MNDRICREYQNDLPALLEGALGRQEHAALLGHMETCAACRAEYAALQTLRTDLEAIGESVRKHIPQVDLMDGVMHAVARAKARHMDAKPNVVLLERPRRMRRVWAAGWLGLTAAAAAVLLLWFSGYRLIWEPAPPASHQASAPVQPTPAPSKAAVSAKPGSTAPGSAQFEEINRWLAEDLYARPPVSEPTEETAPPDIKDLTVADVLALRRAAVSSPDARAHLAQWASLTQEKAREVAAAEGASLDAKVGASQVLPPAEAQRILLAAVQKSPTDPYLRNELAKAYTAQSESSPEATQQLTELGNLDPTNAWSQYKLASNLFSQGNTEAAIAALERARSIEQADPYTLDAEAARHQALQASGANSEVARLLTALTEGMSQYMEIISLGTQLINYGRTAQEQGDATTARQIYESTHTFGAQVAATSPVASDQLGGLDVQSASLDSLNQLLGENASSQDLDWLSAQIRNLENAYTTLADFFQSVNEFFSTTLPDAVVQAITDFILQNGDIHLPEVVPTSSAH